YAVDGIHMDDYFYPTTDLSIDKANYDASGSTLSQENWRRENVNNLVKSIYAKIKSINPAVTFGISPQGNNDNNYNSQYSDVKLWLSQPGYADYIMPQLYWGFNYLTKSGRADYQFTKLAQQWAGYPRADEVKLYIGLGAYRIGGGDGGSNDQSEWSSGTNLANMVSAARAIEGIGGCGLYRYDNLFKNSAQEVLAHSERANLKERYNN
ncbi:MAG: family 10 glycosylhydrolase, partial [Oscillospiraceae bacterium]